MVFLVWSTKVYHVAILGQTLPRVAFTKHYRRGEGLDIDVSVAGIRHQVAGWATFIRVYNVEDRKNHKGWWHGGGRHRKEIFEIIRPVGL